MNELYNKFLKEYDDGDLEFNTLKYRQGASITCPFGLTEGYIINQKGTYDWSSVRIHTGIDRAGTEEVYAPFNFQRSSFTDFGVDHVYGSLIRLFQDEYGFEMRIVHMHPLYDIKPNVLKDLKLNNLIKRNTYLGTAGEYGMSDGAHTHTEIVSYDKTNPVLNFILYEKYGERSMEAYSDEYILKYYKSRPYFKNKAKKTIDIHFEEMLRTRQIPDKNYFNEYSIRFIDWFSPKHNTLKTRYSSELLFNGL